MLYLTHPYHHHILQIILSTVVYTFNRILRARSCYEQSLLMQPPSQRHRTGHLRPAFPDLQFPVQNAFSQLQRKKAYILNSADVGRHNVIVTWACFNSNLIKETTINPAAIIGVLSLFPNKAEQVTMVKRMMNIGKSLTEFRNPSQTSAYEWINLYTLLRSRFGENGMIVWTTEICIDVKPTLYNPH